MKYNTALSKGASAALIAAVICTVAATAANAANYAYKEKGAGWKNVDKISYRSFNDSYDVVKSGATYKVKRSNVIDLKIPQPKDWSKTIANVLKPMAKAKDITALEKLAGEYAMLKWDIEAYTYLVPIYEKKNQDRKIIEACESIQKITKKIPESLLSAYWGALGRENPGSNKLKAQVTKAIESGSRGAAAAAYIARGDILAGEGKPKKALIEGYFRAVILFEDIKAIQPEALYKTWKTMIDMGDRRGEKFRRKLVDEYPKSRYAREFE